MHALLILLLALLVIGAAVTIGLRAAGASHLWPAAILIATAPLEVYRSSSSAGANLSLFRLALLVAFAMYVRDLVRRRQQLPTALAVPFAIYGAFLTWQVLSLLFVTANKSLAYRYLGQYAGGLAAAFIVTRYARRRDAQVLVALVGASVVLPILASIYRVFSVKGGGQGDLPGLNELPLNPTIEAARQTGSFLLDGTQRLSGTFSDPNHFAFYAGTVFLVLAGAVCRMLVTRPRGTARATLASGLLLVAVGVTVVGTYSRSAWLLVAVGLIVIAILLGRAFWSRRRLLLTGVGLAVIVGVVTPLVASRLSASEPGNAISTNEHVHTMRVAVKLAVHHPLLGVGLAGYGRYVGEPPLVSAAHSTWLTVAAELGLPGLLLLFAAVIVTTGAAIRSSYRGPPADRALLAGFTGAFVGLAVANVFYDVWMDDFQWMLFGLVLALTAQPMVSLAGLSRLRDRLRPRRSAVGPSDETPVAA